AMAAAPSATTSAEPTGSNFFMEFLSPSSVCLPLGALPRELLELLLSHQRARAMRGYVLEDEEPGKVLEDEEAVNAAARAFVRTSRRACAGSTGRVADANSGRGVGPAAASGHSASRPASYLIACTARMETRGRCTVAYG